MSFESGATPRRLLQTHGAFINAVLSPNLKQKRHYHMGAPMHLRTEGKDPKTNTAIPSATVQHNRRLNDTMNFVSNDEVFDAREGEILVYSQTESGFPAHRRGALFSSLNGFKVAGVSSVPPATGGDPTGNDANKAAAVKTAAYDAMCNATDPQVALHNSDLRYVGLCQNAFISSNQALSEQGMAVQVSGIKTIINDSEETIAIGDKLMVDTMRRVPSKVRKGIPNEKVRLVLRKVPQGFVPHKAMAQALARIKAEQKSVRDWNVANQTKIDADPTTDPTVAKTSKYGAASNDEIVNNIAALVITEFRKAGHWVVGVAENSARHGEQLDVLLTKPSFV